MRTTLESADHSLIYHETQTELLICVDPVGNTDLLKHMTETPSGSKPLTSGISLLCPGSLEYITYTQRILEKWN